MRVKQLAHACCINTPTYVGKWNQNACSGRSSARVVAKPVNTVSNEAKQCGRGALLVVYSCSRIVLVRVLGCLNVVCKPELHRYKC